MSTALVKAHVRLSPSSAHRWIPCGASLRYDKAQDTNEYAREGTAAHALAELALKMGEDCDRWIGVKIETENGPYEVTEDMAFHTQVYVDFCRSLLPAKHWVERKIDLAPLDPPEDMRGTSDFIAYNPPERLLDVVDLKYGQGVIVEVAMNPQELYYALGAVLSVQAEGLDIEQVRITIVQPRASHADGASRSFTISIEDLLGWAGDLLEAARRAIQPDAPAVPGEWCRFCPGAAVCPALARLALVAAQSDFEVLDTPEAPKLPAPEQMSREQLARALAMAPLLDSWLKAIEAHALDLGMKGEPLPGTKVVEKRATRKWVGDAYEQLFVRGVDPTKMLSEPELLSPAQLEKRLGKREFKEVAADLCPAVSSGYTLARESDAREAKRLGPATDFDVL